MPAGWKGLSSGIMCLRRCGGNQTIVEQQLEIEMRIHERNNSAENAHSGADICLQPVGDPMSEQVDARKGGSEPTERLCWSRVLAGPVALCREKSKLEEVCCRTCDSEPS